MSDANLITLKDIAEQLGINYRTMIDYKNHFREFIKLEYDGQGMKYPERYTDFFRLILAMKEEGYSTSVAKMSLTGEIGLPAQEHLCDWIKEWQDGGKHPNVDGCIQPSGDKQIHPGVEGCTQPNVDGYTHPSEDEDIQAWMEELDKSIEVRLTEIQEITQNKTEATLSALTPQINGATTQLYKAVTELQLELKDLHARLAHLEKELGAQPAPNPVLVELDLEGMQISVETEKPAPLLQHATMDFVKASISDGKPDKQAVVQWIMAERERSPDLSYTDLAEMLDNAGVPTLRGGNGWHRGTIRNLSVKRGGKPKGPETGPLSFSFQYFRNIQTNFHKVPYIYGQTKLDLNSVHLLIKP